jgi:hypothetical protein
MSEKPTPSPAAAELYNRLTAVLQNAELLDAYAALVAHLAQIVEQSTAATVGMAGMRKATTQIADDIWNNIVTNAERRAKARQQMLATPAPAEEKPN